MTKPEILKAAHAEARAIVIAKHISYAEAFIYGQRRVYNKLYNEKWMAYAMAKPKTPKFMWLRGM